MHPSLPGDQPHHIIEALAKLDRLALQLIVRQGLERLLERIDLRYLPVESLDDTIIGRAENAAGEGACAWLNT